MAVIKVLDCSTAHLPPSDRQNWEDGEGTPTQAWNHPDGYGAFFAVPGACEDGTPDDPEDTTPAWAAIFAKARELGCVYVLLDCDAPEVEGLFVYDDTSDDPVAVAVGEVVS